MAHRHPTTDNLSVIIGGVYSYVNQYNYVTVLKVSRVENKSIYVFELLNDGQFSTNEARVGVSRFIKYTYQPNFKL